MQQESRATDVDAAPMVDDPWQLNVRDVIAGLNSDTTSGLSEIEVNRRKDVFGRNVLNEPEAEPTWRKVLAQFNDPLVAMLLVATLISLFAWRLEGGSSFPVDAVVIVVIVIANAALGLWQERKAEQAVAALQSMTQTQSRVVRGGKSLAVASSDLVPGDLLIVGEGDAVGADARLVQSASLSIAEAPLTGESESVFKQVEPLGPVSIGDRTNMIFNGTAVTAGRGVALVTSTGMDTEMGHIARLLDEQEVPRTPLQKEIAWVGKTLGIGVSVLTAVVVLAIVVTSDVSGLTEFVDALLVGVSLAVAAVPEGLPAILSVVLALGVQRMASTNAVVKKLPSVETLGSASVICTDKTGTLTRNEMTITNVVTASGKAQLTGIGYTPVGEVVVDGRPLEDDALLVEIQEVVGAGSLANDADLRMDADGSWTIIGDPTEAAFLVAEQKLGVVELRTRRFARVDEIPFTSERKMMTTLNTDNEANSSDLVVIAKGAPDVLLERCVSERRAGEVIELSSARRQEIQSDVEELAGKALRTLAVAYRPVRQTGRPADDSVEHELTLLGVVGIIDPPRPEAAVAIGEAHRAGIRVVMITGDHPRTAERIGQQLGVIGVGEKGLTGAEVSALTDSGFEQAVQHTSVFARVAPEHKLMIVERLQDQGAVVAMTGDGVNDAPALRRADIGVAMGITGTEVSKEAADMILADDNFASLVKGVSEGRAIFANISKFLRYLLSSNAGEVLVMFLGIVGAAVIGLTEVDTGLAVPLLATQILWINLLTDTGLALALGVDPAVDDPMVRPPRKLTDRVIDRSMMITIGLTGLVLSSAGLIVLDLELAGGLLGGSGDITSARTQVFTTLVFGNVFAAFNSRSQTVSAFVHMFSNRLLWLAAGVTVALQVAVVHFRPLGRAFDTSAMNLGDWVTCVGLSSAVLWAEEIRKFFARRHTGRGSEV